MRLHIIHQALIIWQDMNSEVSHTLMLKQIPCLHGDPIAGSNPDAGSDPSSGVALTRVYTVIPFTEQTPQLGQIGYELDVYINIPES